MKKHAIAVLVVALAVLAGAGALIWNVLSDTGWVAELLALRGRVERAPASSRSWSPARAGGRFDRGEALRTGRASRARVGLADGGELELASSSVLRFGPRVRGARRASVRVESGSAEVHAGTRELSLETALGTVRVSGGGHARMVATPEGTQRVEVLAGRVVVEQINGRPAEVRAGQSVEVLSGRVVIEQIAGRPPTAAPPVPATTNAGAGPVVATDAGVPGGIPDIAAGPGPGVEAAGLVVADDTDYDVEVAAGENVAMHVPFEPIAVKLGFGPQCPGGGQVTLRATGRHANDAEVVARGGGSVVLAVPAHSFRYELRCLRGAGRPAATGSLHLRRDTASAALPSHPPHFSVDTDGHRYSVLYQNLLPGFTVTWPSAATSSSGYTLSLRDAQGRVQQVRTSRAEVDLPAGRLGEGTWALWFQCGGQRSPETVLAIQFDNTARTAQIREPTPGTLLGSTVRVSGSALAGSQVQAGGRTLALDAQNRFAGEVPGPQGRARSLVIRISHPSRGVRYYLRRAR